MSESIKNTIYFKTINDEFIANIKLIQTLGLKCFISENICLRRSLQELSEYGIFDELMDKNINDYVKLNNEIENYPKIFNEWLNEKLIIDSYEAFELFLYENTKLHFKLHPDLLQKKYKFSNEINNEEIIEKATNNIFLKNIKDIISQIENDFSLNFLLTEIEIDKIYLISLSRNALIHNKGNIDQIFITKLEKNGIDITNIKVGQKIMSLKDIDYGSIILFFMEIADKITGNIIKSLRN